MREVCVGVDGCGRTKTCRIDVTRRSIAKCKKNSAVSNWCTLKFPLISPGSHRDIIPILTNEDREPQRNLLPLTPDPCFRQHSIATTRPQRRDHLELHSKMTVLINVLKFYLSVPVVMISSSLVGYVSPIPSLRFWSRAVTCYCALLLCASYGVIASIMLRIAGRPTLSQWTVARSFAGLTGPLIGFDFDIQGEDILAKNRPAVFISNHQRYF